jgi:pre-mRNA-splicing helicase BRR2
VLLLEHDKFDLIKLIRDNRHAILYCTLLARAQTTAEKTAIEAKMSADEELSPILTALRKVDTALPFVCSCSTYAGGQCRQC